MTFPTPYTVETSAYQRGAVDAHGNEVQTWAAPVEQRVIGWSVPNSVEPKYAGADRTIVDVELYVPPSFTIGPRDRVSLPGGWLFEVAGYPEDYTHGPFNFRPGLVVNLVRVEG